MLSLLVLGFLFKLIPIKPLSDLYYHFQECGYATVAVLRKIEKLQRKKLATKCSIYFLEACIQHDITPRYIDCKRLRHQQNGCRILIQDNITTHNYNCTLFEREIDNLIGPIRKKCNIISWLRYVKTLQFVLQREKVKKMDILNAKLRTLLLRQKSPYYNSLINLTDIQLSTSQKTILERGLKQPWFPRNINQIDQQSFFEQFYYNICISPISNKNEETYVAPHTMKPQLLHIFHKYTPLQQKATRKQHQQFASLRALINNSEVKVLEMDKGTGTVLMKTSEYEQKAMEILSDTSKFRMICNKTENINHPIITYENRLQRVIRGIIKPKVTAYVYNKLYPTGGGTGKFYGTAKVHKNSVPLRPVIAMINTPQYNLSKYLDELLRPYLHNKHTICSSFELTDQLKHVDVTSSTSMVSFDVCNLFTNVPLNETIDLICNTVCTPDNNQFPYSINELRTLLTIVNEGYFEFKDSVYKQIDGISMGNPLAPLFSEFFMASLEDKMFNSHQDFYPRKYMRYVDDTLCFFDSELHVERFLNYINSLHRNIQFTVEKSINNNLPFLDIRISIQDGIVYTELYRKPTFTGRLLHFKSIVPRVWKSGLIKDLVHRAYNLSSNWSLFNKEINCLPLLSPHVQWISHMVVE